MHEWHLYYRTSKEVMVIGCPQLRVGKLFRVPPEITKPEVHQPIVQSYVMAYYQEKLDIKQMPESLSHHKTYLSRARILCTYKVDM